MSVRFYALPLALTAVGVGWFGMPKGNAPDLRVQDDWCRDHSDRGRGWYCEVREFDLSAGAIDRVDAGPNGGIRVTGWDRNEISVAVKVEGYARTDEVARDLVSEVEIETSGPTLRALGPRTERRESWSVSYRLSVPRECDLSLSTTNGGISIEEVVGDLEFRATNGGVTLRGVGGDVRGQTTNGGLRVELAGAEWVGRGLDARTTNGGVRLVIPDGYNAVLESGTTNGRMTIDFPITVSGRIDRRIHTELGQGGALVKAITTNGGVTISRR
jgi:hypothetical protein